MDVTKVLSRITCGLMTVVIGMYLINYVGTQYLYLPSVYVCSILALTTLGYAILLFLLYRFLHQHRHFWYSNKEKVSKERYDSE